MKESKPFVQGKKAFLNNQPLSSNPYKKYTAEYEMWEGGYKFSMSYMRNR